MVEQRIDQRPVGMSGSRMDNEASGFVDDDKVIPYFHGYKNRTTFSILHHPLLLKMLGIERKIWL